MKKFKLIHMPTLTEYSRTCTEYSRLYVENILRKTTEIYVPTSKNEFSLNPYPKEYARECKTNPKAFMWIEIDET